MIQPCKVLSLASVCEGDVVYDLNPTQVAWMVNQRLGNVKGVIMQAEKKTSEQPYQMMKVTIFLANHSKTNTG